MNFEGSKELWINVTLNYVSYKFALQHAVPALEFSWIFW